MRVDLVYITAGGGHLASARAVSAGLAQMRPDWSVQTHDLFRVLDPGNQFRRITGSSPADFYNKRLARGWTLGMAQELKLLQFSISLLHERFSSLLADHWRRTRPDVVVSLVPNFNRAMYAGLRQADPAVPFVTLLTDFADHPPNFWIERDQVQDFVCGTERAATQAVAAGHAPDRVHRTSGMVLHPRFHHHQAGDRSAERVKLGLDPQRPVGAVLFGGTGSRQMLEVSLRLDNTPLILLCGRNRALAALLRRSTASAPRVVVEFTDDVPYYLAMADFFIGKPGPGSLSEAIAMGLPPILLANRWTMPQEAYNVAWMEERGLGLTVPRLAELAPAVERIERALPEFQARVKRIHNGAVFEIPALLERIAARERDRADAAGLSPWCPPLRGVHAPK